jgi:hypothetical protein
MKTYRVRAEVRQQGAIGVFDWRIFDHQAENIIEAEELIRKDISDRLLEPRCFCIRELVDGKVSEPWPTPDGIGTYMNEPGTKWEKLR